MLWIPTQIPQEKVGYQIAHFLAVPTLQCVGQIFGWSSRRVPHMFSLSGGAGDLFWGTRSGQVQLRSPGRWPSHFREEKCAALCQDVRRVLRGSQVFNQDSLHWACAALCPSPSCAIVVWLPCLKHPVAPCRDHTWWADTLLQNVCTHPIRARRTLRRYAAH